MSNTNIESRVDKQDNSNSILVAPLFITIIQLFFIPFLDNSSKVSSYFNYTSSIFLLSNFIPSNFHSLHSCHYHIPKFEMTSFPLFPLEGMRNLGSLFAKGVLEPVFVWRKENSQ